MYNIYIYVHVHLHIHIHIHHSASTHQSLCPAAIGPQAIVQGEAAEGQE